MKHDDPACPYRFVLENLLDDLRILTLLTTSANIA